jgi:murein L,D-transpeptidase YafK
MKNKKIIVPFFLLIVSLVLLFSMRVFSIVSTSPEETTSSDISAFPSEDKSSLELTSNPSISSRNIKIPDSIVSLSSGFVVVVDKKFQKLYVFHKSDSFSKVFEAPCSTGKNQGDKQVEGDARTPNGIFFTTRILRNPGPPETFGSLAFPLDYPTLSDQRAGKDGNNIWIHGTTNTLLPNQSNGCVVLRDSDLKRLENFILLNRTPVIISEQINWVPQNHVSPFKKELQQILMVWNKAFVEKDIKKLDSLYREGAEIKGKRRDALHDKIKNLKIINKHFALQPRDISILQDVNNAVIIFDQIFNVTDNNIFQGFYNKLVLERIDNTWFVVDDATTPAATAKLVATSQNTQDEIRSLVNQWQTSWSAGDMKAYRNCYAPDFSSRSMDLDAWIAHKISVRDKSRNIRIRTDNLKISSSGNSATVSFTQYYTSSIFRSSGKKTLELKKINGDWKIHREIM